MAFRLQIRRAEDLLPTVPVLAREGRRRLDLVGMLTTGLPLPNYSRTMEPVPGLPKGEADSVDRRPVEQKPTREPWRYADAKSVEETARRILAERADLLCALGDD